MKRFFARIVIAVLLSITALFHADRAVVWGEEVITEHQAMEIANNEILKRGEDVNSLTIDLDKRWHPEPKKNPEILGYFPAIAAKLRGRNFWAVHYSPKSPYRRGGAFTVFVEKETGEVLGVIAWE